MPTHNPPEDHVPFLSLEDQTAAEQGPVNGAGAMAILTDSSGQILLHLRDDLPHIWYPAHWALFGGAVEDGETSGQAVRREIWEELGVELVDPEPFCRVFDRDGSRQIVTIFHAPLTFRPEDATLSEGQAIKLFAPEETADLRITPFLHTALNAWLKRP